MKQELKFDPTAGIKKLRILTNRLVNAKVVGNYKSVFKGRGLEFLDYRHYTPNDDAGAIDWKASVRSKELLVKEFAEERNLNVFFLIDVSSSMIYSSIEMLKIEYSAELIATLSYVILEAGDSISFAFFNDKIVRHEPPASGLKQYYKLVNVLLNPRYYGGACDLNEALKFTISFSKESSIVIIVSDFIGLKNDWKQYLRLVGKKYDLIGIMIRDPRDETMPEYDGQVVFGDSFSDKQLTVNVDSIKDEYEKFVAAREKEIATAFSGSKSNFIKLTWHLMLCTKKYHRQEMAGEDGLLRKFLY